MTRMLFVKLGVGLVLGGLVECLYRCSRFFNGSLAREWCRLVAFKETGKSACVTISANSSLPEEIIYPFLPEEIIYDILTYLPVRPLVRFKCVCKLWNSTILDPHFISLHKEASPCVVYEGATGCVYQKIKAGLVLEKIASPLRYRIRNPAMHTIVDLPNPQHPSLDMDFDFPQSNPNLKMVSAYKNENQAINYEVLYCGNESIYSWRPLKVPNLYDASGRAVKRTDILFKIIYGVGYCVWKIGSDIHIDILDIKKDRYIGNTIFPRGFFSELCIRDYLVWEKELAFGKIVRDELHVLLLEDYEKQKWADRKLIIKLPTCLTEKDAILHISALKSEVAFLAMQGKSRSAIFYDLNSGKVRAGPTYEKRKNRTLTRHTLFAFKGMRSTC